MDRLPRKAKRAGRLLGGFEYQHHVAAWYLLELLTPGGVTTETTIESDDGTALDDIVQRRAAGTEYVQIKWGADEPAKPLVVESLTAEKNHKTLIGKVASAWRDTDGPVRIVLWTNKGAAADLTEILNDRRLIPRAELAGEGQSWWDALQRASGLDPATFAQFTADLEVRSDAPDQDTLAGQIDQRLADLGLPDVKDELLRVVRDAATYRRKPFTRDDLVTALQLGPQRELTEDLGQPEFGYMARDDLQSELVAQTQERAGYVVVLGQPGSGKSAFLDAFMNHLPSNVVLVGKHFTYIPSATYGTERVREDSVLETLLSQIQRNFGREEIRLTPEAFHTAIRELGAGFRKQDKVGIIVLDALDELVAYRDEAAPLLDALLPEHVPPGIVFVLSAQGEPQLPLRLRQHAQQPLVVGPLERAQAEELVRATDVQEERSRNGWPPLSEAEIGEVVEKASRLPLLVIMLARRLMFVEDVTAELAAEPPAEGDVRRTFANLWDRSSAEAQLLLAALAAADERLSKDELREVARITEPEVLDAIRSIRHALGGALDALRPYHRFLSRYILDRDAEQTRAAAGRLAEVWGPNSDDPRAIRRRWQLLIQCGRGDEALSEFNEDLVDRWIYLGVPTAVIERNADLLVQHAATSPAETFERVAMLRTILAQRLQDLPSDAYARALAALRDGAGLRRHVFDADQPTGERMAASIASAASWRAGRRDEADELVRYALRPRERREAGFRFDDLPDALETAIYAGLTDFEQLLRQTAEAGFVIDHAALQAVARAGLQSGYRDQLLTMADTMEPVDLRRRVRRAILVALLDDEVEARRLGATWHDDMLPLELTDDRRWPDDGWDLTLVPLLALELTAPEEEAIAAASSMAAMFLDLRQIAKDVRTGASDLDAFLDAATGVTAPPLSSPGAAIRELVRWTVRGRTVSREGTADMAKRVLRVPNRIGGPPSIVDGLRSAKFEDPDTFVRELETGLLSEPDDGPTRFDSAITLVTFAAEQRAWTVADELFRRAIQITRSYGWHKDIAMELVVDTLERAYARAPSLRPDILRWTSELLPSARLLPDLTDMDEHSGTIEDLERLQKLAEVGDIPKVRDRYWSEKPGAAPADWRKALDQIYVSKDEERTQAEADLRAWVTTANEEDCGAIADAILGRRSDGRDGWMADRLFGEVVRREIQIESARWSDDAVALAELARLEFRFFSGAFDAALDGVIALTKAQDARLPDLMQRVHRDALLNWHWSGWDITSQEAEIAAGSGDLTRARSTFDALVAAIRSRFAEFIAA